MDLGLNLYRWQRAQQNRDLIECIAPLADALRQTNQLDHLWFTRFGARGPHVFLVFGCLDDAARSDVEARIHAYIAEQPPSTPLADGEQQERHDECRGKALWIGDRQPGLAEPDTTFFAPFDGDRRYPYRYAAHLSEAQQRSVWRVVGRLTQHQLARLQPTEQGQTGAALAWLTSFDQALQTRWSSDQITALWRRHAGTLVLGLNDRWQADPETFEADLSQRISPNNRAAMDRAWAAVDPTSATSRIAADLLDAVGAPDGNPHTDRLLREIHHVALLQLGVWVSVHIPLVLYLWHRNLATEAP
ncbi:MAG: hypothetical protein AAF772_04350 [Acidobacteriota bacterium]